MPKTAPLVGPAELSALLRISTRQITNWRHEGCPTRNVGGTAKFDVAEVVEWLREKERDTMRKETAPDEAQERARKLRAEADLKELELAQARGEVVAVTEFQTTLEDTLGRMRAVVSGQLARFERRFVTCASAAEARLLSRDLEDAICRGAQAAADEIPDEQPEAA